MILPEMILPSLKMKSEKKQLKILKAMAHPARLEILKILQDGALCAGKTNDMVSISQPNFSQHLKILRDVGLIKRACSGTRHCYYLAMPELVDTILKMLEEPKQISLTSEEVVKEVKKRCKKGEV
jgi:DNA-binding transcriptional ArsR family regulator